MCRPAGSRDPRGNFLPRSRRANTRTSRRVCAQCEGHSCELDKRRLPLILMRPGASEKAARTVWTRQLTFPTCHSIPGRAELQLLGLLRPHLPAPNSPSQGIPARPVSPPPPPWWQNKDAASEVGRIKIEATNVSHATRKRPDGDTKASAFVPLASGSRPDLEQLAPASR